MQMALLILTEGDDGCSRTLPSETERCRRSCIGLMKTGAPACLLMASCSPWGIQPQRSVRMTERFDEPQSRRVVRTPGATGRQRSTVADVGAATYVVGTCSLAGVRDSQVVSEQRLDCHQARLDEASPAPVFEDPAPDCSWPGRACDVVALCAKSDQTGIIKVLRIADPSFCGDGVVLRWMLHAR